MSKQIEKFLSMMGVIIGVVFTELMINKLFKGNHLLTGLATTTIFMSVCGVIKQRCNASWFQIISFILATLMVGNYILYTMLNPVFDASNLFGELNATSLQIDYFNFLFPLVYGVFQLLGGVVLSKYNFVGFFAMVFLGSCSILFQNFSSFDQILLLRILSGIGLSVLGVFISYYPTKYWDKKYLNLIINTLIFFAIKFASLVNNVFVDFIHQHPEQWKILNISIFTIFMILSFLFLCAINFSEEETTNNENETNTPSEEISLWDDLKDCIDKNKSIITFCALSMISVIPFYYFRTNSDYTNQMKAFGLDVGSLSSNFNNMSAYIIILGPLLINIIGAEAVMLLFSAAGLMGNLFLYLIGCNDFTMNIFVCSMSFAWFVHSIPSLILGGTIGSRKSAGVIFSLLNLSAMFLGSSLFVFLLKILIKKAVDFGFTEIKLTTTIFLIINVINILLSLVVCFQTKEKEN